MKKIITVTVCDRCGKECDLSNDEPKNLNLIDYDKNLYDLCPECFKSLERWFDNKVEEAQPEVKRGPGRPRKATVEDLMKKSEGLREGE